MREILLASEKAHERPALERDVVTDRAAENWIAAFERIENGTQGDGLFEFELHLALDACQRPQMGREQDSDHGKVWASTESTPGKSRTIGFQLSPLSAEP